MDIIFEDNHLLAINKKVGETVLEEIEGQTSLLEQAKAYIKETYNKAGKVFLHAATTLDRPEAGAVLFVKTSKAADRLKNSISRKKLQLSFWAICGKRPKYEVGHLTHYLRFAQKNQMMQVFTKNQPNTVKASMNYELKAVLGNHNMLIIHTKTNHRHQIRSQLGRIRCPIRGDRKYGASIRNKNRSIHLFLHQISFPHPVTKDTMKIQALPDRKDDVWRMFEQQWT